jgi:hypothetical protein
LPASVDQIFEDDEGTVWAGGRGLSRLRDDRWERFADADLADLTIGGLYQERDRTSTSTGD